MSLPKFLCALRTSPPDVLLPVCLQFDSLVFEALSDLTGGSVTPWARLKASLPVRLGGLGLCQAGVHSLAIFLGSVQACKALIFSLSGQSVSPSYISSALQTFCLGLGRTPLSSLEDLEVPVSQKSLSRLIDDSLFNGLLSTAPSPRFRALALSSSLPHAGAWTTVLPSGLHFLSSEFVSCTRYWLGIPLTDLGLDCPICLRPSDPYGDHAVACGGNGERISRHNSLRDILYSAAQSAALSPRREVPSLVPGSVSRPADIFIPSWSLGQPAAMDVTVISPLQQLTLDRSASDRGYALLFAEERKNIVHFEDCRRNGIIFQPLAMETLGGWSQRAVTVLRSIGRHLGGSRST